MTSRASRALPSVVLLLGLCLTGWGPARGAVAPRADQAAVPAAKLDIGIKSVTPQVPIGQTSEQFTLKGAMRNVSSATLKDVTLCLNISYMRTRYDMATRTPGSDEGCTGGTKGPSQTIAPNQTPNWTIQRPTRDLLNSHASSGVYAIDVVAEDSHGEQVGVARTFVVWKPAADGNYPQPDVAVLWPVTAATTLAGTSNGVPAVSGTAFTDQLDPNGRLTQVVELGKLVPSVNWVVDPDVLDSVYQLSNSYTPLGGTVTGGAAAGTWLNDVKGAIKGAGCYTLPYTDPDLVSLAHTTGGSDLVGHAAGLSAPVVAGGCDDPGKQLAWPADGAADMATMHLINQKLPSATAVVSSRDYKAYDANSADALSTRATVDGKVPAIVTDSLLSSVFDPPATDDGGLSDPGALAGQKWLAQMAFLLRDNVADRTTVIAAPPRDFTPSQALVSAIVLSKSWVGFTTLDGVIHNPRKQAVATRTDVVPAPATPNLKPVVVQNAVVGAEANDALMAIVQTNGQDAAVPLRTVSTSWRGHAADAEQYSATIYHQVTTQHSKVSFLPQSAPLTLSGKSGTVPVTIQNNLPTGIVVDVQACSESSYRVKVTRQPGRVAIPGNSQQTVKIPVSVVGNGQQVGLRASLYTPGPDGQPGEPYYSADSCSPGTAAPYGVASLTVKISAIGIIALALMIGSATLLVVAIGLRVYRAKRAHHDSAQDTMAS